VKQTKILIGDSQFLVRQGLEQLVAAHEPFDLLGLSETGGDLLEQAAVVKPDVIILDYRSELFGLELIRKIKLASPDSRILVISADLERDNIFKSIELGANSFVTKNCSRQEIINAIVATAKDERFFCNTILEVFIERPQEKPDTSLATNLTEREIEILQLIGKGHSTKELADLLHLSQHTIYTHRKNMMKKLGVSSSTDMILSAVNLGLIKPTRKTA
jgi:DNA-binding NarL/FixJ family response regulator